MVSKRYRSTTRWTVSRCAGRASAPVEPGPSDGPWAAIWWRALPLSALLLAAVLSGCVGEVPAVPSDDAQLVEGREIYARNCVGCHGVSGGGGTGPKLSDGEMADRYADPTTQAEVVANGRNQMPAFVGKLTESEVDAVVRFTREGL